MEYKPFGSPALHEQLEHCAMDGMDLFLLENDTVRAVVLSGTRLVNQMRGNHGLGIIETLALGYGYLAALLISGTLKDHDRIWLEIACEGPMKGMSVEVNGLGQVRGYLSVNQFLIKKAPESFDLSPFIGNGRLTIRRLPEGAREATSGTVNMDTGSIAHNLAVYFRDSEQTHSAFRLSVWFDRNGELYGAGGILLQALPGADPQVLEDLDEWLPQVPDISKSLASGSTAASFFHEHFHAFSPRLVGSRPAEFHCNCSYDSFLSWLSGMSKEQRAELAAGGPMPLELLCHNCGTTYHFDDQALGLEVK